MPVEVNQVIEIVGNVKSTAEKLHFFLMESSETPDKSNNIPFVFAIRFDQSVVIRNSKINGKWPKNERNEIYFLLMEVYQ